MRAFLRPISSAVIALVATAGCGGTIAGADARDGGAGTSVADEGGPDSGAGSVVAEDAGATATGYPSGMIAAWSGSGEELLSFFTYDETSGFVRIGGLGSSSWARGLCVYVAFDRGRNLYVGCQGSPQQPVGRVFEFANGSMGEAPPIRTVTSSDLATADLANLAVDAEGNIYVPTQVAADDAGLTIPMLSIFGETSDTTPIRTLGDGANGSIPIDTSGVALDAAGNMYVSSTVGPVYEFSAGASGDASPIRSFGGGSTGESGLAMDAANRLYVATYVVPSPNVTPATLVVFGPDGSILRSIGGPATGLSMVSELAIDAAGRTYVGDFPGLAGSVGLRVFGPGASGNVAPEATLAGVGEYALAVAP